MYLNCHSYFSLRYGTLSIDELVALAQANGIEALALTDVHNSSACYDFVLACRAAGIHPVVGMEFRRDEKLLYIALARNLKGFGEINAFYSQYAHAGRPFPDLPPYWTDVYIVYPWARRDEVSLSEAEYLGVGPDELRQLLRSRYRYRPERLVILQPLTFVNAIGRETHRILRAIDHNTLLSKLPVSLQADARDTFIPPDQLRAAYADFPALISQTQALLEACSFNFRFGQRRSRQTYTGGAYDDMLLLEKLAREGLLWRYGALNQEARRRLESELEIINQLNFNAYFLITWDFVRYGQSRGFFHIGRGSGANSITAYCLGITDVDPIELDLYFERFLNPQRDSPPDFDIDYSWQDRDEMLDYMLKRYQGAHAALLATYHTFKGRSAIREISKAFGLPKQEIDQLVILGPEAPAPDEVAKRIQFYAQRIQGFPNHLGIHAGGVLISEAPMHQYTATDLPPKGFPITHFDMYVAEDIGLHKFDILSQRGLGHIRDTIHIVREREGPRIDIRAVERFKKDPKIRSLLRAGKTIGCFYVESPAMRSLLRKLHCDDYRTLVAASSVIRPGVARSGMMQAYISRHNGETYTPLHPDLGELLAETHGVMVYQEDVIKVVHGFAGLSLAEADLLRRAMSGKTRGQSGFQVMKDRFFAACAIAGHDESVVAELWRQIESFAGYSFSKAHSASFAIESYQSLYLKAHYPIAFMVAVVNNFGGFYKTEFYLHEARCWGADVHAPCVNQSKHLTRLLNERDIYLGFIHLKDLKDTLARQIERERALRGPYLSLADFRHRLNCDEPQLILLIRIGAFRFTGHSKATLMWEAKMGHKATAQGHQVETLFATKECDFHLPKLPQPALEDAYDEMELLGFPLCSPFDLVPNLPDTGVRSAHFPAQAGKLVCIVGYYLCAKTVKTIKGSYMQFANFIDMDGAPFDVTLFPHEYQQYPLAGTGVYVITGFVAESFGTYSVELTQLRKYLYQPDPRMQ